MGVGADIQGGGVLAPPSVQGLGAASWAQMTGMASSSPLVGGRSGSPGYEAGQRQTAVGQAPATLAAASGHPAAANWRELFNFKGNPVSWICLATIAYLGLTHIQIHSTSHRGKR